MFEVRAEADSSFEVMMYGTISQWEKANATDFAKAMNEAVSKGAKVIVLPTHSGGGSIYEGFAMGNKIEEVKAKGVTVIMRVDGLCASMAAVIGATCSKTQVARNIRMMVHEGKTGKYGSVKDLREEADTLEALNADISKVLAEKTGKDAKWITENWLNGKDIWFNAQQALDAKLADEIIDPKVKKLPNLAASTKWNEMAASYDEFFKPDNKMNEDLKKLLGLPVDATDQQVNDAVAKMKLKADASVVTPPVVTPPVAAPEAVAIAERNQKVVDGFMKIAAERGVTDPKKIEALKTVAAVNIDAAFELLPKKDDEAAGGERLSTLIAEIKNQGAPAPGGSMEKAKWGFEDWQTKDPQGFNEMLVKEPAKYKKLFKDAFGIEPSDNELKGL